MLYTNRNSLNKYAILSIALVLFILEIYLIIILHTRNLPHYFKESIAFVLEMDDGIGQEDKNQIRARLYAYPEINKERIEFMSKEAAMQTMIGEMREGSSGLEENPFKELFVFYLNPDSYSEDMIDRVSSEIRKLKGVSGIYHADESFEGMINNISKANWLLLVVLLFLIFMILLILFSTIRIKMINNRFQIKTMELVGAETNFIQNIYQKDSFQLLIRAISFSLLLLVVLFVWLYLKTELLNSFFEIKFVALSVLITVVLAYIIVYLTTKIQVNRYISKHFYELYEP